jgi:hypothetical protein
MKTTRFLIVSIVTTGICIVASNYDTGSGVNTTAPESIDNNLGQGAVLAAVEGEGGNNGGEGGKSAEGGRECVNPGEPP